MSRLDSIIKHYGLKKVHQGQIENCCWQLYVYPTNFHVRFELFALTKRWDNVVANGDNVKKKENIYNFFKSSIQQGCPMTNFEDFKSLSSFES